MQFEPFDETTEFFDQHLTPACIRCGKPQAVRTESKEEDDRLLAWARRELLIQEALPTLSVDQRELLMTGIHPSCWDAMFKDED